MRVSQRTWFVVAAVVPCAVVLWASVVFVWNHFAEGPFLHDAGWYSAIVWRAGLLPKNPPTAHVFRDYYSIHVSPLVSVASVLSYLAPIGRIRWYCAFQGAIYAPLGAVVAMLVGERERRLELRDAALVGGLGVLFALNGQVLACLGYPHFEISIATGACIMLAALATGRVYIAWIGLVLCAATREDGGLHAASFAGAVLASDLLGRPFPVPRRTVAKMTFVAAAASVVAFTVQKAFFTPADLFRHEYLGDPAFAHLTGEVLGRRFARFFVDAAVVSFPLVATVVVAIARRDARYLLGWIVELPWLALNLLAFQELKSAFTIYTGFPFVGSIFWVAAYARVADRGPRERAWLGGLAVVSLSATLGMFFAFPTITPFLLGRAFVPSSTPTRALEQLASTLERDPTAYGALYLDPGITSWALEKTTERERMFHTFWMTSFDGKDGAVFFANGAWRRRLFWFLARSPFSTCGRIPGTDVFFCAREGRPLPPMFVPGAPMNAILSAGRGAGARDGVFAVDAAPAPSIAVYGAPIEVPSARYTAEWQVRWGACLDASIPRARVEVISGDRVLGSRSLDDDATSATDERAGGERGVASVDFEVPEREGAIEVRAWSGRCAYVLEGVRLTAPEGLPPEPPE